MTASHAGHAVGTSSQTSSAHTSIAKQPSSGSSNKTPRGSRRRRRLDDDSATKALAQESTGGDDNTPLTARSVEETYGRRTAISTALPSVSAAYTSMKKRRRKPRRLLRKVLPRRGTSEQHLARRYLAGSERVQALLHLFKDQRSRFAVSQESRSFNAPVNQLSLLISHYFYGTGPRVAWTACPTAGTHWSKLAAALEFMTRDRAASESFW